MRAEGIEPSASDLKGPRSTTELRPQDWYIITSRLLCQLSYAVMHKGMSYLSTKLVYHDSSRPTTYSGAFHFFAHASSGTVEVEGGRLRKGVCQE